MNVKDAEEKPFMALPDANAGYSAGPIVPFHFYFADTSGIETFGDNHFATPRQPFMLKLIFAEHANVWPSTPVDGASKIRRRANPTARTDTRADQGANHRCDGKIKGGKLLGVAVSKAYSH
jgi:hypothetical protein